MKHFFTAFIGMIVAMVILAGCASTSNGTSETKNEGGSRAKATKDSLKMAKLIAVAQYPLIKGGKFSGVIPVADPTEIPDPNRDYKLLFEVSSKNPDSLAKEINSGLNEVARLLNLHVASGIPANKLFPVIIADGPGIEALTNNEYYRLKHSTDNPNITILHDLEQAGAKFIVCGQAMAFHEVTKADLLPGVKVSLTAQTVLSNYQLQGYVLYSISSDR